MTTLPRRLTPIGLFLFGVFACLGLSGCGRSQGTVSGKVTQGGTPLKGGYVTFVSQEGGPNYTGTIQEDGSYSVPNVRSGSYKVCVDTESLKTGGGEGTPGGKGMSSMSGPPPGFGPGGKGGGPPPGMAAGMASAAGKMPGNAAELQKNAESGKLKGATGGGGGDAKMPEGAGYKDAFATMKDNAAKYVAINTKYRKPETTDITVDIKGSQTFDIPLVK